VTTPLDNDNTRETGRVVEADDFETAVAAVTCAIRAINADQRPGDGGEFITHLLATVAANLGSTDALTAARPGSWEAAGVQDLVSKAVGWDDEYLLTYRTDPFEVVINTVFELDDLGMYEAYEASTDHIGRQMFGQRWTRGRGNLTYDELGQIEEIDERLGDLELRDRAAYQQQLETVILAEFDRRRALTDGPDAIPQHLTLTVRFTDATDQGLTDGWSNTVESRLYQHARETTPLPGSDITPDWTPGHSHVAALLAAGHWPHLRIPTLAHYGTPTTTAEEN
jgi:hypothetical protein